MFTFFRRDFSNVFFLISGSVRIAEASLPRAAQPNEVPPPLRISQRMKLEPSQLEGVDKRISVIITLIITAFYVCECNKSGIKNFCIDETSNVNYLNKNVNHVCRKLTCVL